MKNHPFLATQALFLTTGLLTLPAFASPFWTFDNNSGDANFGTAANWDSNTASLIYTLP